MTFRAGDIVAMLEQAMGPRLRGAACTREELRALTVIGTKNRGRMVKLTTRFAGVGWEPAKNLVLVRRGEE